MHDAPAVTYPVGRSSVQGLLVLLLWFAGVAATLAWAMAAQDARPALWAVGACGLCGAAAGWAWAHARPGELRWESGDWQLSRGRRTQGGEAVVAMDLQASLLVRWHSSQGNDWLWLERRAAPQHWDGLRRAVYSRARVDAPPPSTGAATP